MPRHTDDVISAPWQAEDAPKASKHKKEKAQVEYVYTAPAAGQKKGESPMTCILNESV